MLSERILTRVTRVLNRGYLNGEHVDDVVRLPDPDPETLYMLYTHVPFCRQLCTYCSFNRFYFEECRARAYFKSLRKEMRMVADQGYRFGAMYVGGGTPTVLLDELVETIDLAKSLFPDIADVSSETNPTDLGDELYDALHGKVDRLSVGVQSFDNDLLHQMSRYATTGSAEETLAAVQSMQGRFHSFNVDMIFNFPSQTLATLERDLDLIKQTGCNQTTFYPLMASPLRRKQLAETIGKIDYGREFAMYQLICDRLADSFVPSSAWTFSADPDMIIDEYVVDYPEYVGIGSGAMSYLKGCNYVNTFSLREYHDRIAANKMSTIKHGDPQGRLSAMRYTFASQLFGLRLDKKDFERRYGMTVERALPLEMDYMRLIGAFDINNDEEITLTDKGRYLMVAMMRETLGSSNDYRDRARASLSRDEYHELLVKDGVDVGNG
ncbi:MAG: coproporphyrinogen III oxidase family protein [Coriobacteriia bacterium]|nr:coproporphyrinogen III oxidase family protein [Coriobacteriia bacterium]